MSDMIPVYRLSCDDWSDDYVFDDRADAIDQMMTSLANGEGPVLVRLEEWERAQFEALAVDE